MKNSKPRANSQYKQGYFRANEPSKYRGNPNSIIYRSSWELKVMQYLDQSQNVLAWSSEEFFIAYYSPLDQRGHKYYVDFIVITQDNEGKQQGWILEVKPLAHLQKPTCPKRMTDKSTKNYLYAAKQYIINKAKFEAARQFCDAKGLKFGIITENFIFKGI